MYELICNTYIKIIKERGYKVDTVLKKHNYEFTFKCMMDLSSFYDHLLDNTDMKLTTRLKDKYGIDREYQKSQDEQWDDLNNKLEGLI